jgi:glucosamine--fructose-6-phosphate aminotransferase (isomerizing)
VSDLAVVQGQYLRDILEQPVALEETLSGLQDSADLNALAKRARDGGYRSVVLTGMGSSYHVLHPLNIQLVENGISATMVETSELVHYQNRLFDPDTLIIVVSQSGQSAEIVRMLEMNDGRSALIGVTNTRESPLARKANATLLMRAGNEFSVSCKTYLTSLLTLRWLGDVLCNRDLEFTREELGKAAPAVRSYLAKWKDHVKELMELLRGSQHLFLVGRGPSLAAVGTGALIVKEADRFHAEGMSSAAFRHGPLEMLSRQMFVLIFAGNGRTRDLNLSLLGDIAEQSGRATLVSEDAEIAACRLPAGALDPASAASIQPVMEILPVQMITLALAAEAGREPGRFEIASKVTTKE